MIGWVRRWTWLAFLSGMLSGCGARAPEVALHEPDQYPQRLSAWGVLSSGATTVLATDSVQYELNTALFSDYALKLRTLHLPESTTAHYQPDQAFEFPVGTVVSKTFFYAIDAQGRMDLSGSWDHVPNHLGRDRYQLIETRLLIRQPHGWDGLPYVWRGDDAYLAITGDLIELPLADGTVLNYLVPSRNQCAGCHATDHTSGALQPIGLKARHLNRPGPSGLRNQLVTLAERGWLDGLPEPRTIAAAARLDDADATLTDRARAYLDINCGHCHNAVGAADTSGLLLDAAQTDAAVLGRCKPPIAAGRGSGGRFYSIVPGRADQSIMTFRMASTDPAVMMPELGRTLAHTEGVELVAAWIDQLDGACR